MAFTAPALIKVQTAASGGVDKMSPKVMNAKCWRKMRPEYQRQKRGGLLRQSRQQPELRQRFSIADALVRSVAPSLLLYLYQRDRSG